MKYILVAILFFNTARAQDYVANWTTVPKEVGVANYQIQVLKSNGWATIATIAPKKNSIDSNYYAYILPVSDNSIRIKILMIDTILNTIPIKIVNTNVAITNPLVKNNRGSDNLSFTSTNENAVSYYSIEKSNYSGNNWTVAGKLWQSGKKNYVLNIYGDSRKYRLISIYKNGIKSDYVYF